jgi:hypothetical protein
MMETKIAILDILLNTQDFSSVILLAECMTYPQKRFRQTTATLYLRNSALDLIDFMCVVTVG